MRTNGGNGAGRFSVDFEVANSEDLVRAKDGTMPRNKVRRQTISGVVDCGAAMLVLPETVVKELGVPLGDMVKVRYTDGRRAKRREAKGVFLKLLGRDITLPAVVEPKRKNALIGAIVLEALDLLIDPKKERLIPRDPSGPIYEIE
jgi:predicted aspartyl protease